MMAASSRAVVTGVAVGALALAASLGEPAMAATVAVEGVVFALGWPRLVDVPSRVGSAVVISLALLTGIATLLLTENGGGLALVVAGGVIASFVHQMVRRDGRPRLVETVSATVTGVVVVVSGLGWLLTVNARAGVEVVLVACAVVLAAAAVTVIPARGPVVATAASVVAGLVGLGVGFLLPMVGPLAGVILGAVVGALMALSHLLFNQFPAAGHRRAALAAALMPVLSLGGPVFLVTALVA